MAELDFWGEAVDFVPLSAKRAVHLKYLVVPPVKITQSIFTFMIWFTGHSFKLLMGKAMLKREENGTRYTISFTDTRHVASTGEGFVLHLWYWAASSAWKFLLSVISISKFWEIKMWTRLSFLCCFFFSFQCSDKSCLRTPSLKKRVIDINLEGKKDSGMLKYIRHQVLTGPYAGWGDCYINVSSNCNRKENIYGSLSLCEGKNCRCWILIIQPCMFSPAG